MYKYVCMLYSYGISSYQANTQALAKSMSFDLVSAKVVTDATALPVKDTSMDANRLRVCTWQLGWA